MIIKKLNESQLRIECDLSVAQELSDTFSFLVPGYKYMPAFRMGKFDGYIRLFNLGKRTLPLGLFDKLKEFCAERDYEYSVIDSQYGLPGETAGITYEDIESYVGTLGFDTRSKPIEVRDYQIKGIHTVINSYRAIVHSATGCMDPHTEIEVELDDVSMQELLKMRKLSV